MVSRRKFFSIFIMMAVLFFMFQFSRVYKESGNNYNFNSHVPNSHQVSIGFDSSENSTHGSNDFYKQESNGNILLIESGNESLQAIISQWCSYSKRNLKVSSKLSDYESAYDELPALILVDGKMIKSDSSVKVLLDILASGVPIAFCNLPDSKYINEYEDLRNLLGIKEVKYDSYDIDGIYLFSGFLLGGEAVYKAQDEISAKRQDLTLTIPWYVIGSGTKTYMTGMISDEEVEREEYPAIIWRNNYNGTYVFACLGDYMESLTGMGIMEAFMHEIKDYDIYPVVNAQNIMVADFPGFALENTDALKEYYGRDSKAVYRDLIWPEIEALARSYELELTCFMTPQFDYFDDNEPDSEEMVFYLQQLNEINAETGRSLTLNFGVDLKTKDEKDNDFYDSSMEEYQLGAAYVGENIPEGLTSELNGNLSDVYTLGGAGSVNLPVISFYTENVILQSATGNVLEYYYSTDFCRRSLYTAIGYSNAYVNMYDVTWPDESKDRWENFCKDFSSNIDSYWSDNDKFRKTTLSESDISVRSLLNLQYTQKISDDKLKLEIFDRGEDTWFILRTHGEDISKIDGAEYEEIEDDAFLLEILSDTVEISFETSESVLQYNP